jgi:membrane associated rhomboid family serine protease
MLPIRDENPTRTVPYVNYIIILANALVFLYFVLSGADPRAFFFRYGLVPAAIARGGGPFTLQPVYLTFLTSMFVHANLGHIFGNMLYLWIFGDNVEDAMGHWRYLAFYLLTGLGASLIQMFTASDPTVPTVGASGAVSGILGAYLILFPRARVIALVFFGFFIRFIRVRALFILGFWIVYQVLFGVLSLSHRANVQGTAWFAHIGGFAVGVALVKLFARRKRVERDVDTFWVR